MTARAHRGWGLLLVILAALGCRASEGPPASEEPVPERVVEIPRPSLDRLDGAVVQQLTAIQAAAESMLRRPSSTAAEKARATGKLAMHYDAYGMRPEAGVLYAEAIRLAPAEPKWHYLEALNARQLGDLEAAAAGLQHALRLGVAATSALVWQAQIARERGDETAAAAAANKVLASAPTVAAAHQILGEIAFSRGEYSAAASHLERVVALEPSASATHYLLAQIYRRLGDGERAAEHLRLRGPRRPRVADPLALEVRQLATGATVHLARGSSAMRSGALEVAAEEFLRAVEMDPEDPTARLNSGAALAQLGRATEAMRQLHAALELPLEPASRSKVHFNLGFLLARSGQLKEAGKELRLSLASDPGNQQAAALLTRVEGREVGQGSASPPLG